MTVVAIDPGVTTGIAIALDEGTPDENYVTIEATDAPDVWTWLERASPRVVILEQFTPYGRVDDNGASTLEICGWVKAFCHSTAGVELVIQTPQERIAFIKRASEILQSQGIPLFPEHQKDALAHLFRWKYETRPIP